MSTKNNFYVYILECSDGSYYTGYTNDLKSRLDKHNSKTASKYTRSRTPVKYVYTKEAESKNQAMSFEAHIKTMSKEKKIKLVNFELELEDFIENKKNRNA